GGRFPLRDDVGGDVAVAPRGRREVDLVGDGRGGLAGSELRVDDRQADPLLALTATGLLRPLGPGPGGRLRPPVLATRERHVGRVAPLADDVLPVLEGTAAAAGLPALRRIRRDKDSGTIPAVGEVEEHLLGETRLGAVLLADAFGERVPRVDDDEVVG